MVWSTCNCGIQNYGPLMQLGDQVIHRVKFRNELSGCENRLKFNAGPDVANSFDADLLQWPTLPFLLLAPPAASLGF